MFTLRAGPVGRDTARVAVIVRASTQTAVRLVDYRKNEQVLSAY